MSTIRHLSSRRPGGNRPTAGRTERPVSVRLDEERLSLLTGLAIIDETSVAEQIRLASEIYIQSRLDDPLLIERAERAVARFKAGFAPLLEGDDITDQSMVGELEPPSKPRRDLKSEKPVTLRLDNESVDYFTSLALLDNSALADQLRAAVDLYVSQRRQDESLERRIHETQEEHSDLLARLRDSA